MYTTDVDKGYCSCPAWKYQRVHPSNRTCKHLDRARGVIHKNSQSKHNILFMLVANAPPAGWSPADDGWVYQRKFDGNRVALLPGGTIVSRGGYVMPISMPSYRGRHTLDCELVASPVVHTRVGQWLVWRGDGDGGLERAVLGRSRHTNVSAAINKGEFTLVAFDLVPRTGAKTKLEQRLKTLVGVVAETRGLCLCETYTQYIDYELLEWEGVVARRLGTPYVHGKRRRAVCFKLKKIKMTPVR